MVIRVAVAAVAAAAVAAGEIVEVTGYKFILLHAILLKL